MKRRIILTVIMFLTIPTIIYAQSGVQFGLFGLLSMPMGDYGSDNFEDNKSGYAGTGYGFGIDVAIPLSTPGLSLIGSAAYIHNGTKTDEVEDYIEREIIEDDPDFTHSTNVDFNSWLNIPILGGLKYASPVSPTLSIYGLFMVGINIVRIGDREINIHGLYTAIEDGEYGYTIDMEESFDGATSFCFSVGGGVVINELINIGFRFYKMGEPEFDGEFRSMVGFSGNGFDEVDTETADIELDVPISMILFTVGINL